MTNFQDRGFSDMHKDAYGFRPSVDTCARWRAMSEVELDAEEARLQRIVEAEIEREKEQHAAAAVRFEQVVAETIATGAHDRAMAIRWLVEAHDAEQDIGYFEYQMGLEYGYVARAS